MRKLKLVMVGTGWRASARWKKLRKIAPDMYEITVFGAEPHPNYKPHPALPVLAGEMTIQDIILNDLAWYADNGITLHLGSKVTEIDRKRRSVVATGKDGEQIIVDYDRLLIATGSTPSCPRSPATICPA